MTDGEFNKLKGDLLCRLNKAIYVQTQKIESFRAFKAQVSHLDPGNDKTLMAYNDVINKAIGYHERGDSNERKQVQFQ